MDDIPHEEVLHCTASSINSPSNAGTGQDTTRAPRRSYHHPARRRGVGISPFCPSLAKSLPKILLNRLVPTRAEEHRLESQCGTDTVFVVRQLQEKCRKQNKGMYATFVDLTKTIDTVSRKGLWQILQRLGCPGKSLNTVSQLHEDQRQQNQTQRRPVRSLPNLQRRKTGLRPGTNPLQHLFQNDAHTSH